METEQYPSLGACLLPSVLSRPGWMKMAGVCEGGVVRDWLGCVMGGAGSCCVQPLPQDSRADWGAEAQQEISYTHMHTLSFPRHTFTLWGVWVNIYSNTCMPAANAFLWTVQESGNEL